MKELDNNQPKPQKIGEHAQKLVRDLKDKVETRKRKSRAPDDDIVFWHNGFSVNLGGHWSNKDEPMSRPAIQIDVSKIPPGLTELRAYLCPRTIRKTSGNA